MIEVFRASIFFLRASNRTGERRTTAESASGTRQTTLQVESIEQLQEHTNKRNAKKVELFGDCVFFHPPLSLQLAEQSMRILDRKARSSRICIF